MPTTLHIDGGARGNPGPAAAGVVIRRDGTPIFEAGFLLGRMTNNQAEYHALLRGLNIAAQVAADDDLAVFSDSELLVKQITGEYETRNAELRELLEQAHQLMWKFESPPQFQHVRRSDNKRADEMVNAALDARRDVIATNTTTAELPATAKPAPAQPKAAPAAAAPPPPTPAPPTDGGPVRVTCVHRPLDGGCPGGCVGGQSWSFGDATPPGICTHAGAAILPVVSALLQAPVPEDEDPADMAEVDVRCPRTACKAVFRVGYAPRS